MGLGRAELSFAALEPEKIPMASCPRIVVVGRSNVGKSSLLNAITHPHKIFRTGKTPGLTRGVLGAKVQLGNNKQAVLEIIDVPGTGFAQNQSAKVLWGLLLESLREKSAHKALMFLWLIEAGRRPDAEDLKLLEWLDQIPFSVVFTKVDKLKSSARLEASRLWENPISHSVDQPFFVSSTKNEGLDVLFKSLRSFVREGAAQYE